MDFALIKFVPVPIFLYSKKILSVNSALLELSGFKEEEVTTLEVWELFADQFHDFLREAIQKRISNDLDTQIYELQLVTKNKELRWVKVVATTFPNEPEYHGLATLFDFTEEKKLTEELLLKDQLWTDLFNHSFAVMLLIDPRTGEIKDANPAASNFYGYSLSELQKMKIEDINMMGEIQIYKK